MYAFTIACYNERVPKVHLHKKLMSQPPWDSGVYSATSLGRAVPWLPYDVHQSALCPANLHVLSQRCRTLLQHCHHYLFKAFIKGRFV